MRWALRNQDKIVAHFGPQGESILKEIKDSLDDHFQTHSEIETNNIEGQPYPILEIPDIKADTDGIVIEFYVIRRVFDVYNLAFKGFFNK